MRECFDESPSHDRQEDISHRRRNLYRPNQEVEEENVIKPIKIKIKKVVRN